MYSSVSIEATFDEKTFLKILNNINVSHTKIGFDVIKANKVLKDNSFGYSIVRHVHERNKKNTFQMILHQLEDGEDFDKMEELVEEKERLGYFIGINLKFEFCIVTEHTHYCYGCYK
jgi:hypothetical protein